MRFGDSANTPELPPNAKPGSANGLCQPRTTSYGLGPTGPEMTPGVRLRQQRGDAREQRQEGGDDRHGSRRCTTGSWSHGASVAPKWPEW